MGIITCGRRAASADRLTGKSVRIERTVANHEDAADEQILDSTTDLVRPLVRGLILYGRWIEHRNVCIHPGIREALRERGPAWQVPLMMASYR